MRLVDLQECHLKICSAQLNPCHLLVCSNEKGETFESRISKQVLTIAKKFIGVLKWIQILKDMIVMCAFWPSSQVIHNPSFVVIHHQSTQGVYILSTTVIRSVTALQFKCQQVKCSIHTPNTIGGNKIGT